jgi:hypothetical protein
MRKKKFTKKGETTAANLERKFDDGENVLDYFDVGGAVSIRRITLDMPEWSLRDLDTEAARRGVTRQSLIKNWLIDRLDSIKERKSA